MKLFLIIITFFLFSCTKSTKPSSSDQNIRIEDLISQPTNQTESTNDNSTIISDPPISEIVPTNIESKIPSNIRINLLLPTLNIDGCLEKKQAVYQFCDDIIGAYVHPSLDFFYEFLCTVSDINAADHEYGLCLIREAMEVTPDIDNLPQEINTQYDGNDISYSTQIATEEFALELEHKYKSIVKINSQINMVIYWGFEDDDLKDISKTKGFIIQGYHPSGLVGLRASYYLWNFTNNLQQSTSITVKFPSANNESSQELVTPQNYFLENPQQGDSIYYSRINYNTLTLEQSVQAVAIMPEKSTDIINEFGCFKVFSLGKKNGNVMVSKSRDEYNGDNFNNKGHSLSSTALSVNDMDGVCLIDNQSTSSTSGILKNIGDDYDNWEDNIENLVGVPINSTVMDLTCFNLRFAYVSGGTDSGAVFSLDYGSTWVNFEATPNDVFPQEVNTILPTNFCQRDPNCECQ